MKKIILFAAAAMMAAVTFAQTPTVSASKVTMKYCKTTYGTVPVFATSSSLPITVDGFEFASYGTYVRKLENVRGCDSVVTYVVGPNTEGMLPGKFIVNAQGKKIQFAKGNLMYLANNDIQYPNEGCLMHKTTTGEAQGEWKFGETQYAYCGNIIENGAPNSQQTKWMDLFGYATSGFNSDYPPFQRTSSTSGLPDNTSGTNYDWGVFNAITGGGNYPNLWRSITGDEWDYIIAHNKYGWGKIDDGKSQDCWGFIILPNEWNLPEGCSFNVNNTNNSYTIEQWNKMEQAGAVFLITDYYSQSASTNSLSGNGGETIYRFSGNGKGSNIYNNQINSFNPDADDACHIRLVCDVEE